MSRRISDEDQEFGSDSFLDIIANIVGILIILIVVAGVKVARQSTLLSNPVEAPSAISEPAEQFEPQQHADDSVQNNPFSIPEISSAEAELAESNEKTSPPIAESELVNEIAQLELHLEQVRSTAAASEQELERLLAEVTAAETARQIEQARQQKSQDNAQSIAESVFTLRSSLASVEAKASSFQNTLTSLSKRQSSVSNSLQQVAFETRQLQETLQRLEADKPSSDRIHHRLSPVGEPVTDNELHFRIAGGRVAHIPLEPLLELLKSQVMQRRDVVMRFHRYEGMVGPVGGFRMQYTVRRDSVSPLQALQYGNSAYRMSVAKWTIVPAETLVAEPVGDALRIGSRFRQILEATDPDTVVTVWLYPDDFKEFAGIRELAHNLNLRVAARPLPDGTPIAGSPTGSRSTSQ